MDLEHHRKSLKIDRSEFAPMSDFQKDLKNIQKEKKYRLWVLTLFTKIENVSHKLCMLGWSKICIYVLPTTSYPINSELKCTKGCDVVVWQICSQWIGFKWNLLKRLVQTQNANKSLKISSFIWQWKHCMKNFKQKILLWGKAYTN